VLGLTLLLAGLLLLFGSKSYAVLIGWDGSDGATGYRLWWGTSDGIYDNSQDVGDVLQSDIPAPIGSYIAATAYNEYGESDFSESIFYGPTGIQPASGGQIFTVELQAPGTELRPGEDYEFTWTSEGWLININDVNADDIIRVQQ